MKYARPCCRHRPVIAGGRHRPARAGASPIPTAIRVDVHAVPIGGINRVEPDNGRIAAHDDPGLAAKVVDLAELATLQ